MAAHDHSMYGVSAGFFEVLVQKSIAEKTLGTDSSHIYNYKAQPQIAKSQLMAIQKIHDHTLDKRGQFNGMQRRLNQYPFDPELRKKRKFWKELNATMILDRETLQYYDRTSKHNETNRQTYQISTQLQVDKLCRGGQLRVMIFIL